VSLPGDFTVQIKQEELAGILTSLEVGDGGRPEVRPEAKLKAVLEISRALGAGLRLDDALPKILESLFVIFPQAERGCVLLLDPDTGQLVCKAARSRQASEPGPLPVSRGVLNHVLTTGRAILSADAGHDERFDPYQSIQRFRIGSLMCVPLLSPGGGRLGVIQLDTKDRRQPFNEEDLEVLISATTQLARTVELARLYQERSDLEAAIRIQKSFLPEERPESEALAFWDYYQAARQIGGDYFDYIPLPGGRLAVALGDVSGKGVAAALLMARVSAAARFCLATEPTVPEAVRRLNTILTQHNSADRFVTFLVLEIDLNDFSLTLVNAGHPPLLRRRGAARALSELGDTIVGLPLGLFDRPYEEMKLTLEPGDTMILYTDGLTEARDPQGDFYGIDRLRAVVKDGPEEVPALGEAILDDVRRFAAGRPQSDDLTMVCVGRKQ
jgi:serine phosphatase RsbU (regulator of sigma subunit)